MKSHTHNSKWIMSAVVAAVALAATDCWADITGTGDVTPADPASWTASTFGSIGSTTTGTVLVNNDSTLLSSTCSLGDFVGARGTVIVDGTGSTWIAASFDVGYGGIGTLNITNGGQVSSLYGTIGYAASATGSVTVDGPDSKLTITRGYESTGSFVDVGFDIGQFGNGTLNITNGGQANSVYGSIGSNTGAVGMVTVVGPNSTWTNNNTIYIGSVAWPGEYGTGTLMITNGGKVTSGAIGIGNSSLLVMNVGDGSNITITDSNRAISNYGTFRLKAVPGLAAGTYLPFTGSLHMNPGATIQALGGSWSSSAHTFIVTTTANGTAGQDVTINRLQTQRAVVADPVSGKNVVAGFQATTSASNLTITATTLTDEQTGCLGHLLAPNQSILSGWTFATTGYTPGDPAALSLEIGAGHPVGDLSVWHYDGATWMPLGAGDLSYDGRWANFTVTGFSGYAVAATPEPGTLAVLALGGVGLLGWRRRRRK